MADVVLVLSDRTAPALDYARSQGITAHMLTDWSDAGSWRVALDALQVDLIVLAGYLKLVPAEIVAAYRGRIINIHPALLPAHGGPGMYGRRVHAAVLAVGDRTSGATVHLVDEVYDRGEILGQATVPVLAGDSPESLADRVLTAEHRLLPQAVIHAAEHGHPVPFRFNPRS